MTKKNISAAVVVAFLLLAASCVSAPYLEKARFTEKHYTFTILNNPQQPKDSHQLELALSLLQMNYPAEQAEFLDEVLYMEGGINGYKDQLISEQRENYRNTLSVLSDMEKRVLTNAPWRYVEDIFVRDPKETAIVVEREFFSFTGGVRGMPTKRYYVIDLEELRVLKVDDFFRDFQGTAIRAVVYEELRNRSGMEENVPLSRGIYLKNEPELSFNFFITQDGIGLHWDPFEIAPHSEGRIEVILPWRKIRPLLLHEGLELLTKFGIYLFV